MSKPNQMKYICSQCGYQTLRWLGKCPECQAWDSLEEQLSTDLDQRQITKAAKPLRGLASSAKVDHSRLSSGMPELDRVLGGGIVPGSLVMIGGDPGIGKSTLMLQMSSALAPEINTLYISGEESEAQVAQRAERLGLNKKNLFFLNENNLETIDATIAKHKLPVVVVDSVQTIQSENIDGFPGNASQLKYCATALMRRAKQTETTIFLIGHVTKDGAIAGPKMLEHLVDTVMYFEGDDRAGFRILRTTKNRYGSINELAVFQMTTRGLQTVENPSLLFLDNYQENRQGCAVTSTMEGRRSILVEVQALVSKTQFGVPQRTTFGIDHRRVNLLLAVLEKLCGQPFSFHDVYVKTAGGYHLVDPGSDLSVCMALISSMQEKPLPAGALYLGEVGLNGELRPVPNPDERIREGVKLGFTNFYVPAKQKLQNHSGIKIVRISQLSELV